MLALCQCEAPARGDALRQRRLPAGPLPVIEPKLLLLDAQIELDAGHADARRAALQRAEPLLDPRASRPSRPAGRLPR